MRIAIPPNLGWSYVRKSGGKSAALQKTLRLNRRVGLRWAADRH